MPSSRVEGQLRKEQLIHLAVIDKRALNDRSFRVLIRCNFHFFTDEPCLHFTCRNLRVLFDDAFIQRVASYVGSTAMDQVRTRCPGLPDHTTDWDWIWCEHRQSILEPCAFFFQVDIGPPGTLPKLVLESVAKSAHDKKND